MNSSLRPVVYFAAPLFSEAELSFNVSLTSELERYVDVFLPQRDGGKVVDLVHRGVNKKNAYQSIFERDVDAIRQSDAVLAILDGRAIDEGVAFELGYAFAIGKVCIGYQSDPRRLLPLGNNPMIDCSLSALYTDLGGVLAWVKNYSKSWCDRLAHPVA